MKSTLEVGEARAISARSVSGRAIVQGRSIHLHDLLADVQAEYPDIAPAIHREGIRTTVGVPLIRHGRPIGAITVYRTEVRPFSDRQIALLQTFAVQAVIAIDNARLFSELEGRNAALGEALEQQTATGEILRVIASSPTDVHPVFETIVHSATRLCAAKLSSLYRYDSRMIHFAVTSHPTRGDPRHRRPAVPPPGRRVDADRARHRGARGDQHRRHAGRTRAPTPRSAAPPPARSSSAPW